MSDAAVVAIAVVDSVVNLFYIVSVMFPCVYLPVLYAVTQIVSPRKIKFSKRNCSRFPQSVTVSFNMT